jgi:DNA-binding response OmpR family regulator
MQSLSIALYDSYLNRKMKILIAEDHFMLSSQLQKILVKQRFSVDVVQDGEVAKKYLELTHYDLLLLDISLPKIDGITLCESLRREGKAILILMLTGYNQIQDKVKGLNAGADDYLTKPFDPDELIARIQALLRRNQVEICPILHWGQLSLNQNLSQIYYEKLPLDLTLTEHKILELLLLNPNHIFSRHNMIDRIWASHREIPSDETIKSHVKMLRKKLRSLRLENLVKTVYGVGYCLNIEFRDTLVQSAKLSLNASSMAPRERTVLQKSVIIYDEECFLGQPVQSALNMKPLGSNLLPDIQFNVDAISFSSMPSLKTYLVDHHPDLLLIMIDNSCGYKSVLNFLKDIGSQLRSICWFFSTKNQVLALKEIPNTDANYPAINEDSSVYKYLDNVSFLLTTSHLMHSKKIRIFVFSTCHFIISKIQILAQENHYILTIMSTFEELWDIQNLTLPTILVMDSQFENFTGIELCQLVRHNPYFDHVPIAMIGDGNPYILDEIIQSGIDYFIDLKNIVNQFQSFADWLNRKSHQYKT